MKDSISAEKAAAECVSDEALIHLKTYKYSAVDKSPVSNYILKPYVCQPSARARARPLDPRRPVNSVKDINAKNSGQ